MVGKWGLGELPCLMTGKIRVIFASRWLGIGAWSSLLAGRISNTQRCSFERCCTGTGCFVWDIHELPRPSIWGYTLYIYIHIYLSDSHNLWPGKSVLSHFRGQKMLVHQRPVLLLILGLQPRSAWNLVQARFGHPFNVLIFWELWQEFGFVWK